MAPNQDSKVGRKILPTKNVGLGAAICGSQPGLNSWEPFDPKQDCKVGSHNLRLPTRILSLGAICSTLLQRDKSVASCHSSSNLARK